VTVQRLKSKVGKQKKRFYGDRYRSCALLVGISWPSSVISTPGRANVAVRRWFWLQQPARNAQVGGQFGAESFYLASGWLVSDQSCV